MIRRTIHTDLTLAATVRDVFGWDIANHVYFTMIRTGKGGKNILLVFDAACELNVHVQSDREGRILLDWSGPGSRPNDIQAARVGHALEMFFSTVGLVEPKPEIAH